MAGAISLAAVFLVVAVEQMFSRGVHVCSGRGIEGVVSGAAQPVENSTAEHATAKEPTTQTTNYGIVGPRRSKSTSTGQSIQRLANQNSETEEAVNVDPKSSGDQQSKVSAESGQLKVEDDNLQKEAHKKALMQCLLLELGILFHSVFIGIALSVAVGGEFVVLLVAITFHRMS